MEDSAYLARGRRASIKLGSGIKKIYIKGVIPYGLLRFQRERLTMVFLSFFWPDMRSWSHVSVEEYLKNLCHCFVFKYQLTFGL